MKFLFVLALFVAAAVAAPADSDAQVISNNLDNIGTDGYSASYQTSNGIQASETGVLQNAGTADEELVVRGQYSYPGQNGETIEVTYVADKNGFQPNGRHLPVAA